MIFVTTLVKFRYSNVIYSQIAATVLLLFSHPFLKFIREPLWGLLSYLSVPIIIPSYQLQLFGKHPLKFKWRKTDLEYSFKECIINFVSNI